ncbi:MAG TPA: hemolysin family protein [Actinomycetota bacterium]|nr:hemolysin family protein [Actinomycetota bacterium]
MNPWLVVATLGLLGANGFFVAAEFALIAARRSKIEALADAGNTRARVARTSLRELSLMLAGAQLGITMASLGLGAIAEPAIATAIETALHGFVELSPTVLHTISFVVALTIVVFFHMVIGEMAPKNVAIALPEKTALWLAIPFRLYVNLFRPFIFVLNSLANAGLRVLRVEPQDELRSVHTARELGAMISTSAEHGMLEKNQHRLLSGAATFGERDAGSAMIPRTEMVAAPSSMTPAELEGLVVATGHTRIPVYAEDLDHILGFFHAKDLLRIPREAATRPLAEELIRPMLVVPESKKLHPLLFEMRRQRRHFALVIEEHGGTAGIVTMEDLLEELVGEIRDEYDVLEQGIERRGTDRYIVPGSIRIDELKDRVDIELPQGEYETVAGYVMAALGRIPRRRDSVVHGSWRVRVMSMHRRRIVQVLIERA